MQASETQSPESGSNRRLLAYEASALPLSYPGVVVLVVLVRMTGVEPAASRSQSGRSAQTELHPFVRASWDAVVTAGFDPATSGFSDLRSTE